MEPANPKVEEAKVQEFKDYKVSIPYVEERYYAKPVPKSVNGQIVRIEYLMKHWEQFLDQQITIAGWARTCRYNFNIIV